MDDDETGRVQVIIEAARKARDKLADIAINPAAYTEEEVLRLDEAAAEAWSILNDAIEAMSDTAPLDRPAVLGRC